MKNFKGKTVLITGGGSGIGKLMGKLVLEKGSNLIILDINPTSLKTTIAEFSALVKVSGYRVDVSNPEEVSKKPLLLLKKNRMRWMF